MKNIAIVFLSLFIVLLFFSCDNDETGNVSEQSDGSIPVVSDTSDVSDASDVSDTSELEVSKDTSEDQKTKVEIVLPFEELTLVEGQLTIIEPDIIGNYNPEVIFESSNDNVAFIDIEGMINAISPGECVITVTAADASATIKITVVEDTSLTRTPSVYDYVYTDYNTFVILGTCEQGATIMVDYDGKVITEQSDHGYFSVRISDSSQSVSLKVSATVVGKNESLPLVYNVQKEAPNYVTDSSLWRVIVGSDYQFHLRDFGYLESFLRENSFTQNQLDTIKYKINQKVELIRQYNPDAELIYMPIPSPATIYPETMPDVYVPYDNKSRIEQIYEVVEESDAVLIDVLSALQEHRDDNLKIFWKTDTHWTDYGAFIAYTELFDYIKTRFPEAAPRSMSDFDFVEDYYYGGDLAYYLAQDQTVMREYNALRVPNFDMPSSITAIKRYVSDEQLTYTHGIVSEKQLITTNRSELPTAIVLRDSYNTQMFDILAERFNTTIFNRMWDYTIYNQYLQTYKPDYVIIMGTERNFEYMFN